MPKILILHLTDTSYTHIYRYTQTHAHIQTPIQISFSHFALFGLFGVPQTYTCTDTSDICIETLTHRYKYTETHACLYTHQCACGKSREIVT